MRLKTFAVVIVAVVLIAFVFVSLVALFGIEGGYGNSRNGVRGKSVDYDSANDKDSGPVVVGKSADELEKMLEKIAKQMNEAKQSLQRAHDVELSIQNKPTSSVQQKEQKEQQQQQQRSEWAEEIDDNAPIYANLSNFLCNGGIKLVVSAMDVCPGNENIQYNGSNTLLYVIGSAGVKNFTRNINVINLFSTLLQAMLVFPESCFLFGRELFLILFEWDDAVNDEHTGQLASAWDNSFAIATSGNASTIQEQHTNYDTTLVLDSISETTVLAPDNNVGISIENAVDNNAGDGNWKGYDDGDVFHHNASGVLLHENFQETATIEDEEVDADLDETRIVVVRSASKQSIHIHENTPEGVRRDVALIRAILKFVEENQRKLDANTQLHVMNLFSLCREALHSSSSILPDDAVCEVIVFVVDLMKRKMHNILMQRNGMESLYHVAATSKPSILHPKGAARFLSRTEHKNATSKLLFYFDFLIMGMEFHKDLGLYLCGLRLFSRVLAVVARSPVEYAWLVKGELGGVNLVLRALEDFGTESTDLVEEGLTLLARYIKFSPRNKEKIARTRGLEIIISVMRYHLRNAHVQASGCNLLSHYVFYRKEEIIELGGVEIVLEGMEKHRNNPNAMLHTSQLLFGLVFSSPSVAKQVVSMGGVSSLVSGIVDFASVVCIQRSCFSVLEVLIQEYRRSIEELKSVYGVKHIMDALLAHPLDEELQEQGLLLIGALIGHKSVTRHRQVKSRAVVTTDGMIHLALKAMRPNPSNARMTLLGIDILRKICNSHAHHRGRWARRKIISFVVAAMATYINIEDIQECGCDILRSIASVSTIGRHLVAHNEGIEAVLNAMEAFTNNADLQYYGCGALKNILVRGSSRATNLYSSSFDNIKEYGDFVDSPSDNENDDDDDVDVDEMKEASSDGYIEGDEGDEVNEAEGNRVGDGVENFQTPNLFSIGKCNHVELGHRFVELGGVSIIESAKLAHPNHRGLARVANALLEYVGDYIEEVDEDYEEHFLGRKGMGVFIVPDEEDEDEEHCEDVVLLASCSSDMVETEI
eukprot:m.67588 g.67588  ORF g.67588 m.67588 type:complete len:1047 (+) comp8221_c3_seq1:121-3261(+)